MNRSLSSFLVLPASVLLPVPRGSLLISSRPEMGPGIFNGRKWIQGFQNSWLEMVTGVISGDVLPSLEHWYRLISMK